ncbi:MAG: DUF2062 domain-containing protein [Burkholderiales bacterium]|nr:DUF2062 domain-containing protein [Burkholderiales bacterium]GIK84709.1 MAG: flagellar biosynthesis protein FlhF [Betaproteobacteria bacterium]
MARHLIRRLTRRLEPFVDEITSHPWVAKYAPRLADPDLWHLNRRSTARAVAVGLFSGLIPGPFQVIGSVALSIAVRANFPLAAITTLYTNPFTIVPLYIVAYEYGKLFVPGAGAGVPSPPPGFALSATYVGAVFAWMGDLGKPLAVGVLMLALTLALVGWTVVRVGWRCHAIWAWRRRARLRAARAA